MANVKSGEVLKGLSESLDLAPLIIGDDEQLPVIDEDQLLPQRIKNQDEIDAEDDFNFTRQNTKDMIEKGNDALDGIIRLANASEAPRAFEIVATMMKTLSEMNGNLLKLHDQRRQLVPPEEAIVKADDPKAQHGEAFNGTTAELLAIIREDRKLRELNRDNNDNSKIAK